MPEQNTKINSNQTIESNCIVALRLGKKKLLEKGALSTDLKDSIDQLEKVLFSAETNSSSLLIECYMNLMFVLKNMENKFPDHTAPMRPIGLQVATANNIAPIHLEWSYHNPNSLFVIEYANFEETSKPDWRIFSKTRSTSFTVRGLPKGKAYWFRISALATAV